MLSPLLLAVLLQGAPAAPAPTTVPSPAAGTGAQAALPPGTIAIAQMRIEAAMAKLGVPGLAVAVVAASKATRATPANPCPSASWAGIPR